MFIATGINFDRIPGDIAGVVYCTVLHQTSEDKEWDTLWKIYLNSNVATEKEMLLSALGCTRKHNLINVNNCFFPFFT